MSKNLNCPNCGAPLDPNANKCSYCGTSYFDMTSINIDDGEPFYLKLKKRTPDGGYDIITAFVRADPCIDIACKQDTLYVETIDKGYIPFRVPAQWEFSMNFRSINRKFSDEPRAVTFEHIGPET